MREPGGGTDSRSLLLRIRDRLAEEGEGQKRLDLITLVVAESMRSDVCSIYLMRDSETLELCATEGLKKDAIHRTRLRVGEGLVGRVAKESVPINAAKAPPRTGISLYA